MTFIYTHGSRFLAYLPGIGLIHADSLMDLHNEIARRQYPSAPAHVVDPDGLFERAYAEGARS